MDKAPDQEEGGHPAAFTLVTAPERFRQAGDSWAPIHGPAIDLPAALDGLRDAGHGKSPSRSQGA